MPRTRTTQTRIAKLSGGLADVRLCEQVLKAFYSEDLQKVAALMKIIEGRSYTYRFHKLTQRGQGTPSSESGLWDLSFAFEEKRTM